MVTFADSHKRAFFGFVLRRRTATDVSCSSTASWAAYLNCKRDRLRERENWRTREELCTAQMASKSPNCDKLRPRSAIDVFDERYGELLGVAALEGL
jgi:hypothetical protein